jgi:crotonobetainyl-CoA:carnitine CoA-transferase CaiB-like acyl-CoA transferase
MTLGDLGAHVIKVERPGSGDDTRGWGPPFDDRGESAYYLSVNRNKKSIALDLDEELDRAMIKSLAREADIVVENFKSGTLERKAIDTDEILRINPRLIWCTISGFGQSSPRVGYDLVVQAESGWMAITGEPAGDPMRAGVALADIIAGKDAAIAILAALASRDSLGLAERRIHISLSASATAALINVAQNSLVTGQDARRWGNQHPNLVPYQLFHAADRPMIVAVGSDAQWKSCARALELHELIDDGSVSTNAGRLAQRERIVSAVAEKLQTRNAGDWITILDRGGVPCGLVNSVLEALQNVDASPLSGIAPSVPGSVRLAPPRLDEHGEEIRARGWSCFEASP